MIDELRFKPKFFPFRVCVYVCLIAKVNYVNAAAVAKETGLAIEVAFSETDPKGYLNGLSVEFEVEGVLNGRRTITGGFVWFNWMDFGTAAVGSSVFG